MSRSRLRTLERQLRETQLKVAVDALESWDAWFTGNVVNPADEFEGWLKLDAKGMDNRGPANLPALQNMRCVTRSLAFENPFCINAHQNLQNFLVGNGFSYRLQDPEERTTYQAVSKKALRLWDKWYEDHDFFEYEREAALRQDRDGEFFLRFFDLEPRWVDPSEVDDPRGQFEFGIITPPDDKQLVKGFIVKDGLEGEVVEAEDMVHVKMNVDKDVLRGVPTMWPIRENLVRASKLLRNMSKVGEVQAAIAMIREHPAALPGTSTTAWLDGVADKSAADGGRQKEYKPGTIIDVPAGQKYHFPATAIDASRLVQVLDAELRACAARTTLAEFMFSMNAGNSNYASLTAAEKPTLKSLSTRQACLAWVFKKVFKRWLRIQVLSGMLPQTALGLTVQVRGPSVTSQNEFQEVRTKEIRHRNGILSARTWAEDDGLDYDEELSRNEKDKIVLPPSAKSLRPQQAGATAAGGAESQAG